MYYVYKAISSTVGVDSLAKHVKDLLAIDMASTKLDMIGIVICRNSAEACHIAREEYGIDTDTKLFAWDKRTETSQEPIKRKEI